MYLTTVAIQSSYQATITAPQARQVKRWIAFVFLQSDVTVLSTMPPPVWNVARLSDSRLRMPDSESAATELFKNKLAIHQAKVVTATL